MHMISVAESVEQGTGPAAWFSIARFHFQAGNNEAARRARVMATEVATAMGIDLGGHRRPRRSANDNTRTRRRRGRAA